MNWKLGIMFMCILWISCEESPMTAFEKEIETFYKVFEEEAYNRGVDLSIDEFDLHTELTFIDDSNTIGFCRIYADGDQEIVLDQVYWDNASDNEKEYLLFHELGHCVLGRDHNNSENEMGTCTSIMQSGTGACNLRYNEFNRSSLLDELFLN